MNPRHEKLKELYSTIPEVNCKGLCHQSCGPILCSDLEAARMGGQPVLRMTLDDYTCPLLKDNRCKVYDRRPMICRLFGAVDHHLLKCPHGCGPDVLLTHEQSLALLDAVEQI